MSPGCREAPLAQPAELGAGGGRVPRLWPHGPAWPHAAALCLGFPSAQAACAGLPGQRCGGVAIPLTRAAAHTRSRFLPAAPATAAIVCS